MSFDPVRPRVSIKLANGDPWRDDSALPPQLNTKSYPHRDYRLKVLATMQPETHADRAYKSPPAERADRERCGRQALDEAWDLMRREKTRLLQLPPQSGPWAAGLLIGTTYVPALYFPHESGMNLPSAWLPGKSPIGYGRSHKFGGILEKSYVGQSLDPANPPQSQATQAKLAAPGMVGITDAYRAIPRTATSQDSHRLFGARSGPLNLFGWRSEERGTTLPTPAVPASGPEKPYRDICASAQAHDALLDYKCHAAAAIARQLRLTHIDVQLAPEYPALLIRMRPESYAADVCRAMQADAVTAALGGFAEFSMLVFLALVNSYGGRANADHIEMGLRPSFGFAAPSACNIGQGFRINVPMAPAAYMSQIAAALQALDGLLPALFAPCTGRDAGLLKSMKDQLLGGLGFVQGQSAALLAYQPPRLAAGEAARRVASLYTAIRAAASPGELLLLPLERPAGRGLCLGRNLAASLARTPAQVVYAFLAHPGEPLRALRHLLSDIGFVKGRGEIRLAMFVQDRPPLKRPTDPGPMPSITPLHGAQALQDAYLRHLDRVTGALRIGIDQMIYDGCLDANVADAMRAVIKHLPGLRGQEVVEALECLDSLVMTAAALWLEHADGPPEDGSDSEIEFEIEPGADAGAVTQDAVARPIHVFSRKWTAHNGMNAITQAILALADLLAPGRDEHLFGLDDVDALYYEMAELLPQLRKWPGCERVLLPRTLPGGRRLLHARDLNATQAVGVATMEGFLQELRDCDKTMWFLDVTSTTQRRLAQVVRCFSDNPSCRVAVLVSSGLKNDQLNAGHPSGTIRLLEKSVSGRTPTIAHFAATIPRRMQEQSRAAHTYRRFCKRLGLMATARGITREVVPKLKRMRAEAASDED